MPGIFLRMKKCFRAARAATMNEVSPVISDFAMIVDDGVICNCGRWTDLKDECPAAVEDLGNVTITPGLINAHTHLGLSHLEGKTVQGKGFTAWIKSLLAAPLKEFDGETLRKSAQKIFETGTVYCADISTTDTLKVAQTIDTTDLGFTVFCESIGQRIPKKNAKVFPEYSSSKGRIAGAGHALYSTHAELIKAVKAADTAAGLPFSIHLAENEEESSILSGEDCLFGNMLSSAGLLSTFPGSVQAVPYVSSLGVLDSQTLVVHCVQVNDRDIAILGESGASVCLCPRSNLFIGEGRAPWEKILSAGINTCLGTDSIASNYDLNLWNELGYLLDNIKISLDPVQALKLVTVNPAKVLGLSGSYGCLEPGSSASYAIMPREIEERLF